MLIDWFTVGAQAVNFLVLLWLLKRFLYAPILKAIDAREKRVADERAEIVRLKTGAEAAGRDLSVKTQAFDTTRAALLAKATREAAEQHDLLMAAARAEGDALRLKQQILWQGEQAAQREQLNQLVTREVFAITRRVLGDLAGAGVEERMVTMLLTRLREMPSGIKANWVAALKGTNPTGIVRSRFALDSPLQALIQKAVNDSATASVALHYETASESVGGIEILVQGQKISWTIAGYLKSLQAEIEALPAAADITPVLAVAS